MRLIAEKIEFKVNELSAVFGNLLISLLKDERPNAKFLSRNKFHSKKCFDVIIITIVLQIFCHLNGSEKRFGIF